jgi:hypothetical protein
VCSGEFNGKISGDLVPFSVRILNFLVLELSIVSGDNERLLLRDFGDGRVDD